MRPSPETQPPARPFPKVPRPVLTAGAVLGGIIGIILSDRLNWSAVQSFLITLGIALGCVVIFGVAYSLVFRRKQGE